MGMAEPSCRKATSADALAATLNCMLPSNPDALPACRPCPAMAQAVALGSTQPRLATQMNSGTISGHSCSGCHKASTSRHRPLARYTSTMRRSHSAGPPLRTSRALTCAMITKPAALLPNSQP